MVEPARYFKSHSETTHDSFTYLFHLSSLFSHTILRFYSPQIPPISGRVTKYLPIHLLSSNQEPSPLFSSLVVLCDQLWKKEQLIENVVMQAKKPGEN